MCCSCTGLYSPFSAPLCGHSCSYHAHYDHHYMGQRDKRITFIGLGCIAMAVGVLVESALLFLVGAVVAISGASVLGCGRVLGSVARLAGSLTPPGPPIIIGARGYGQTRPHPSAPPVYRFGRPDSGNRHVSVDGEGVNHQERALGPDGHIPTD